MCLVIRITGYRREFIRETREQHIGVRQENAVSPILTSIFILR